MIPQSPTFPHTFFILTSSPSSLLTLPPQMSEDLVFLKYWSWVLVLPHFSISVGELIYPHYLSYIYNYIYIFLKYVSLSYISPLIFIPNIKCLLDNFGHPIGTSNLMFYTTVLIIYHKYLSLQSPPGFFSFQLVGQVKT